MNLKIRGCKDKKKRTWIWGYEDAGISTSTYESEGMHEDVRMRGYKQTHTNLGIWQGCEDVRMQPNTVEPL